MAPACARKVKGAPADTWDAFNSLRVYCCVFRKFDTVATLALKVLAGLALQVFILMAIV